MDELKIQDQLRKFAKERDWEKFHNLKNLQKLIVSGRLSFGSPDRLMENLGVRPGAVSPFSMINGIKNNVLVYFDSKLKSCEKIYAHPLVNDKTLELSLESLEFFFKKLKLPIVWTDL